MIAEELDRRISVLSKWGSHKERIKGNEMEKWGGLFMMNARCYYSPLPVCYWVSFEEGSRAAAYCPTLNGFRFVIEIYPNETDVVASFLVSRLTRAVIIVKEIAIPLGCV